LLAKGADVKIRDLDGWSALYYLSYPFKYQGDDMFKAGRYKACSNLIKEAVEKVEKGERR
jgi:hypothetical protein